ncbi:MAG: PrpF family protein [Variovorax paradoxus]|nr:MAG: PrpF family protein [Variovorax paradoxus]PZQ11007.1 MAG: PrpF family protein [Variovorax paradoxus]
MTSKYIEIPAAYVRGGTSRAVLFQASDLPESRSEWPAIFRRVLGSPDPSGRQLDGFGGGISSLSKVAVLGPSVRPGCDVDYHFFQIEPKTGNVQTVATCGNIVSSVGPFAVEKGWAKDGGAASSVRIFDANSGKTVIASFGDGSDSTQRISIDGVPGEAPEIRLTFENPGGAVTGALFPTALRTETLNVESVGPIEVTLVDATLPTVVVRATSVGLRGDEMPNELSSLPTLELMEKLRIAAGLRMGLSEDPEVLRTELSNLPDVVVVSATGEPGSIRARFFSGGAAHKAAPVTSSIALACSCQVAGTVSASLVSAAPAGAGRWDIRHPAGSMWVEVTGSPDGQSIESASVTRTTRLIMEGRVRLPGPMPSCRGTSK